MKYPAGVGHGGSSWLSLLWMASVAGRWCPKTEGITPLFQVFLGAASRRRSEPRDVTHKTEVVSGTEVTRPRHRAPQRVPVDRPRQRRRDLPGDLIAAGVYSSAVRVTSMSSQGAIPTSSETVTPIFRGEAQPNSTGISASGTHLSINPTLTRTFSGRNEGSM